jgi:hypothetical protein
MPAGVVRVAKRVTSPGSVSDSPTERQRYTKHNYSLLGAEIDPESDEDNDDETITPSMTAAAAAGLDAAVLSLLEERDFAHVTKGGSGRTAQLLSVRCAPSTRHGIDHRTPTKIVSKQKPHFFFLPFFFSI